MNASDWIGIANVVAQLVVACVAICVVCQYSRRFPNQLSSRRRRKKTQERRVSATIAVVT